MTTLNRYTTTMAPVTKIMFIEQEQKYEENKIHLERIKADIKKIKSGEILNIDANLTKP